MLRNIILDTDMGNSWDDQFALVYALKNMDKFNIEAITIAPYQHNKNDSIIINQENSYKEIIEIGKLININLKEYVYRGAINYRKNNYQEDNEAVNKIIEIANKNEKTYILALGALTNIALAISKDKEILNKIEIIWLGGNSIEYGNNKEFNFMQDDLAVKEIINSPSNITIIPAKNVASQLMINIKKLKSRMQSSLEISEYLCNRFYKDNFYGVKENRVIWDISVVAYLINVAYFEIKEMEELSLNDRLEYQSNGGEGSKKFVTKLNATKIYDDFFRCLNNKKNAENKY